MCVCVAGAVRGGAAAGGAGAGARRVWLLRADNHDGARQGCPLVSIIIIIIIITLLLYYYYYYYYFCTEKRGHCDRITISAHGNVVI